MTTNKAYVRRLAIKDWSLSTNSGIASLTVQGWQVWWGVLFSWQWWLAGSMRLLLVEFRFFVVFRLDFYQSIVQN